MDITRLVDLCDRHTLGKAGTFRLLPGLTILCRDAESDLEAVVYDPVVCLILQGSKVTSIGDQTAVLRRGDALLVSHDLPVVSRITSASAREPYLALILSLDLSLVRSLYDQFADVPVTGVQGHSLAAAPADPAWVAPLIRYLELMGNPLDARVLGPSILREIHYRLLLSPLGAMLRNLLVADSHASRIARAIGLLRTRFRTRLTVEELARAAGMGASSFHDHFRSVTGTTPLQYLKDLRLIEARSLLSDRRHSVSEAAYAVGYESPTHFSRDYSRKFGQSPSRQTRGDGSASLPQARRTTGSEKRADIPLAAQ